MKNFMIVGGEYVDPMIEESFLTFNYPLVAKDRQDAIEKFHIIFPGCVCVSVTFG